MSNGHAGRRHGRVWQACLTAGGWEQGDWNQELFTELCLGSPHPNPGPSRRFLVGAKLQQPRADSAHHSSSLCPLLVPGASLLLACSRAIFWLALHSPPPLTSNYCPQSPADRIGLSLFHVELTATHPS